MECKRYDFTAQSISECSFFASNLETNCSKMAETGTKKKQFKFRIIMKINLLPAQTPA